MFRNPNQIRTNAARRKALRTHLDGCLASPSSLHPRVIEPPEPNRETILLEPHATPTKQTTEGSSNREKIATFTTPSTQLRQPNKFPSPPSRSQPQALQPPESNRQPKLLETLQLQQNKQPRVVLIDNFYMFSRSNFCRDRGFVALASRRLSPPQFRQVLPSRPEHKRRLRRDRN